MLNLHPTTPPRDRFGRDEDWIDYHPSYREMEKIAFEEFGDLGDGNPGEFLKFVFAEQWK